MGLPEQRERIYQDMRGRVAPSKETFKNVVSEANKRYTKGTTLENLHLLEMDRELQRSIRSGKVATNLC